MHGLLDECIVLLYWFVLCIICRVLYTLYSMHCILCIVFYTLYPMHCILCIVFFALYSIHCILSTAFHAFYYMHCILCMLQLSWMIITNFETRWSRTDQPTDRPTDRRTDIVLYRTAIAAKKCKEDNSLNILHINSYRS